MFRNKSKVKPVITWHLPDGKDYLIPKRATSDSMAYDLVSPITITVPKFDPQLGVGSALIDTLVAVTPPDVVAIFTSYCLIIVVWITL
jgi:hypothetical protein